MVEIIDGGVTTPQGFKAAGVHSGVKYRSLDLGLLYSDVPATACVGYTSNKVKAAPVQVMMKENSPQLSAVVVNSGNANALTGRRGIEDAITMKEATAAELNLDPKMVGVMSTGLIGRFMDMHKVKFGISKASKQLDYNMGVAQKDIHTEFSLLFGYYIAKKLGLKKVRSEEHTSELQSLY